MQELLVNNTQNVLPFIENNPRKKKSILLQSQDKPINVEDIPIMQKIKANQNFIWGSNEKKLKKNMDRCYFIKIITKDFRN